MDYTQSNSFVVHPGTGHNMHDESQATPTAVSEKDLNSVMWSLMELLNVAGLPGAQFDPAVPATYTLVRQAIDVMIRRGTGGFCTAAGTVDAITGDFTPDVAGLVNGLTVTVRCAGANTSSTPTFKADGTAAVVIVKENNQPLLPGDIPGAGYWAVLTYDATLARWVLKNPAAKLGAGLLSVRDEKASGTSGGNAAVGAQTRTLNTVTANTIPGASLSANQITLPAGTYRVRAHSPASVNHRAYLYNVTDASVQILGTSENNTDSANSDPVWTRSHVDGRFTIAATKVFELREYCAQARTGGLGAPLTSDGLTEVFSVCEITKE